MHTIHDIANLLYKAFDVAEGSMHGKNISKKQHDVFKVFIAKLTFSHSGKRLGIRRDIHASFHIGVQ
jgi:hypothetical protein